MQSRVRLGMLLSVMVAGQMLLSGCHNQGMALEGMKNEFEELGQLVSHVRHCGSPVDEAKIHGTLEAYAARNGAGSQEQASLISYYDTAVALEEKNISGAPCTPDDATRNTALLNDKLSHFQ